MCLQAIFHTASNLARFFKPQRVSIPGTFQDGGLYHNNPAEISLWETQFLWPSKFDPDIALSLGTGTSRNAKLPKLSRAPWRLWRSFMRTIDTEEAYKRFKNNRPLSIRDRFQRLNLQLTGHEPRLDDVASISHLKSQMPESFCSDYNDVGAVIDSLISSLFYFELEDVPAFHDGQFHVSGFIFCRLDLSAKGRLNLYTRLRDSGSWFLVQGRPTACVNATPKSNPPFKCRIKYSADTLEDTIAISIRGITKSSKYISGFPTTTQRLVDLQQLHSPFGRVDHCMPEKPLPPIPCKRSSSIAETRSGNRKRRRQ